MPEHDFESVAIVNVDTFATMDLCDGTHDMRTSRHDLEDAEDPEMTRGTHQTISCSPVLELRRYTLHPGTRETLITLFERELIEPQEDAGMQVIAQFRDIDRPDVFTWLRGFESMSERATALASFYNGPVWARHCDAANATMQSWDNVRLLRPVRPRSGICVTRERPGVGATAIVADIVVATIYTLVESAVSDFADWFDAVVTPQLIMTGARPVAVLETEPSVNTFPRLPVREGERAFVWLARFADLSAYRQHVAALVSRAKWVGEIQPELNRCLTAPPEIWRLTPTARSRVLVP